ncbi:adenosylcobinamide-GDP ribazoletransferase [Candidatus Viridilinea mediisalina]|uniref:Adenosylcobinamide-GDP ribazoletransferase n=1 Tax=Candidatus Viridilinea mediisalina TaxID=2024553 RepID=A0A2A6RJF2_9CHLR|nr:adenosylcobinamide-GDP ribazoletransferase [Candidatus Viridilinea mediisalina]PDW03083.1 adenosylcobinamide-GDP ribazoletransferase [Candidatus Viridilinea mediisalina]
MQLLLPFIAALRFMTTLPLGWLPQNDDQTMLRALPWFPAVGLTIGLVLLPLGWLAGQLWGSLTSAALLVVAWALLSGGLHLDGLSDTFDGITSWRPRERKLEIMKDSHIGAMGVNAIIAVLLLKFALLAEAGALWWQALLIAPLLGRWITLFSMAAFPLASSSSLGRSFRDHLRPRTMIIASGFAAAGTIVIAGMAGLVTMLLVALVAGLLATWWTRELGGLTGDTYGALCEISEVVALASLVAAARVAQL